MEENHCAVQKEPEIGVQGTGIRYTVQYQVKWWNPVCNINGGVATEREHHNAQAYLLKLFHGGGRRVALAFHANRPCHHAATKQLMVAHIQNVSFCYKENRNYSSVTQLKYHTTDL